MWIDRTAVFGEAGVASHEMTVVPTVGANVARRSGLPSGAAVDTDMQENQCIIKTSGAL